ncbi:MAG: hypothetical protein IPI58_01760 [Alphaproteobacteria bacterium]|nr:MAG: hypothetical protein IPI58_01760 [Alphaproteobacteria bacterium]
MDKPPRAPRKMPSRALKITLVGLTGAVALSALGYFGYQKLGPGETYDAMHEVMASICKSQQVIFSGNLATRSYVLSGGKGAGTLRIYYNHEQHYVCAEKSGRRDAVCSVLPFQGVFLPIDRETKFIESHLHAGNALPLEYLTSLTYNGQVNFSSHNGHIRFRNPHTLDTISVGLKDGGLKTGPYCYESIENETKLKVVRTCQDNLDPGSQDLPRQAGSLVRKIISPVCAGP